MTDGFFLSYKYVCLLLSGTVYDNEVSLEPSVIKKVKFADVNEPENAEAGRYHN